MSSDAPPHGIGGNVTIHDPIPMRQRWFAPSSTWRADCVFCAILAGEEEARVLMRWPDALAIMPLNPCLPGHTLIIPRTHTRTYVDEPWVSASAMMRAAEYASTLHQHTNLIINAGPHAGQTVFHLHLHVIPREPDDGFVLPWDRR